MGDVDINKFPPVLIQELTGVEPLRIEKVTGVEPLRVSHIAPAAVHIKELNHIDPISVDSLRVDEVRNVDPLRIERLDVTRLPTVNLSVRQVPEIDLNVRRVPPVAIALHQQFCLPSSYTVHARLLGLEFLRLQIHGRTLLTPQDPVRREQSRSHQRSFADVAAVGNPAIPVRCEEKTAVAFPAPVQPAGRGPSHRCAPQCTPQAAPRPELSAGAPRFAFSLSQPPPAARDQDSGMVGSGNL